MFIVLCLPQHGICLPVHSNGKPQTFDTREEAEARAAEMQARQPACTYVVREEA